jgi:hypothetical protein
MEHKSQPLATKKVFLFRMMKVIGYAMIIILIWLGIGIFFYHWLAELGWIDSTYNASMILGGMGPVNTLNNDCAKLFASFYAIVSGVILLGLIGFVLAPVFHRIMHQLHLESK